MGINSNAILNEEFHEKLLAAIRTVDSGFPSENLVPELVLETIPDWDSLTRINFMVSLEQSFQLEAEQLDFYGHETIEDVVGTIKKVNS